MVRSDDAGFTALVRGILAGAEYVAGAQMRGWFAGALEGLIEEKIDKTFVTDTDRGSEAAIVAAMRPIPPGLRVKGEEGTDLGEGSHAAIFDPVDGTAELLIGGHNSTVGGGLLDENGNICGAITILPASGLVLLTQPSDKTLLMHVHVLNGRWIGLTPIRTVEVWEGDMSKNMVVFVDHSHGFVSQGTPVLNDVETALFAFGLARHFTIRRNGSNLNHQMMVAAGRPNVGASVTLAKGGDQDLVGVMHVLGAGGVARGYNVTRSDDGGRGALVAVDNVLKIGSYKVLITAANVDILDRIEHILDNALGAANDVDTEALWELFR